MRKFAQVKKNTTMSPLSSQGCCVQDDCDYQPLFGIGTRTDNVRQIVGNKRVATINPNLIGDNGRGHGKNILLVNEVEGILKTAESGA